MTTTVGWQDRVGIWASTACVVHCVATPILLSFSAVAAHFLPSEERTHRTLAVGIALIGAIALVRGLRRHQRPLIAWLMLGGLSLISLAALRGDSFGHHWIEVAVTFCGSTLMITAHRLNHTFCARCVCAGARGSGKVSPVESDSAETYYGRRENHGHAIQKHEAERGDS